MSIWNFKAHILALPAVLVLAACDELPQTTGGGGAKALTQASLSENSIRLAAPNGYCIDRRSLRDRFALLGRCDTLGVIGTFAAVELAIITVSTVPVTPESATPSAAAMAATKGQSNVVKTVSQDGLQFFQLKGGGEQVEGVNDLYWRTAFVLNGQLVSIALYAPSESGAVGPEGARILEGIVYATRTATEGISI
ncbi:MAG: hypothetical protein WAO69_03065 [Aestuariivita sp.]|uniref:hypothetical protein n=1 Tax=Aestuariivita sp. TaxID=1872407 RepID=UPI003BB1BBCB